MLLMHFFSKVAEYVSTVGALTLGTMCQARHVCFHYTLPFLCYNRDAWGQEQFPA